MEAEARYTYVGLAVVALVLALVASIVWLKDYGGAGNFNRYAIYFEEQALDGLQVGGEVNLRGIKVGRVDDYSLSPGKFNRVRVEVRVDRRAPVRTNTVAVVSRNFVTGIASITLVNREPEGQPLTEASEGDDLPVIHEGRSSVDEITDRVSRVGEQASEALTNVNELLTAENRRAAMDAVRNLRDLSSGLNQRLAALDRVLDRSAVAAASIASAAQTLGSSGERVAAVAERAGERFDSTMLRTEQAVGDAGLALGKAASSIDAVGRQAGSTARRVEDSLNQMDDQLRAVSADLRSSIQAANHLLDRLRDPRAAILGPGREQLGPGERQP